MLNLFSAIALTWSCMDMTGLFLVVLMCRTW